MEAKDWTKAMVAVFALSGGCCVATVVFDVLEDAREFDEADTPELRAAAKAFGARGTYGDCETEALRRIQVCRDRAARQSGELGDMIENAQETYRQCGIEFIHFHDHCLDVARPTTATCMRPGSLARDNAAAWAEGQCRREWGKARDCAVLLEMTIDHCRDSRAAWAADGKPWGDAGAPERPSRDGGKGPTTVAD